MKLETLTEIESVGLQAMTSKILMETGLAGSVAAKSGILMETESVMLLGMHQTCNWLLRHFFYSS